MKRWLLAAGAAALFFAFAWIRYASFHSTTYDLAFFDQAIWNASLGRGFVSSFIPYDLMGQHFEPVLWLVAAMYRVVASPVLLLALQSAALGLAVVPLWDLAAETLGPRAAWAIAAAYLLQVGVWRAVAYDFHTEAMAVPLAFAALLAAHRRQRWTFVVLALAPLLFKEDGALVAAAIGLLAVAAYRRREGWLVAAVAVMWGVFVVLVVMPRFRNGAPDDLIYYYRYLGSTRGAVALALLTRPQVWMRQVLFGPFPAATALVVAALGGLPLLRPRLFVIALLAVLPAALSTKSGQSGLLYQYGIGLVPLLVFVSIRAIAWLQARPRAGWLRIAGARAAVATGLPVVTAAATFLAFSPVPPMLPVYVADLERSSAAAAVVAMIPPGAPLAGTGTPLVRAAHRQRVYQLPAGATCPFIVVDAQPDPPTPAGFSGQRVSSAALAGAGYQQLSAGGGVSLWSVPSGRASAAPCAR
ncbi:MAG TPA: DUF2079 domain-containing protein [Candidatus Solibacter sp.]|nr:DUF2079 domain-containing protein [Candidatus Solibacter sp.]